MRSCQNEILALLKEVKQVPGKIAYPFGFMTAIEFMEAVRIKRTKFDQLVNTNRIRAIKKLRKSMFQSVKLSDILRIVQFPDQTNEIAGSVCDVEGS
jgi:hypothetical protein